MQYQLANSLSEAGFQSKRSDAAGRTATLNGKTVSFPELEELVDACGASFDALEKVGQGWRASGFRGTVRVAFHGATPSDALAVLWLALNQKV